MAAGSLDLLLDSKVGAELLFYCLFFQMKMSQEAVRILTMEPSLRTNVEVHYVSKQNPNTLPMDYQKHPVKK